MSCFKRAEWRSGLTYQQTCRSCGNVMTYMDNILDFRPWFPDGFVYCSKCRTPLRHNELYAIDAPPGPIVRPETYQAPTPPPAPETSGGVTERFCSNCGKEYLPSDRFCSDCGKKRI